MASWAAALSQWFCGGSMALAPTSPSSGVLAEGLEPTPSSFLSLPRGVQEAILKQVEEAARGARGAQGDGGGGGINGRLQLRLVSRAFRDAVDHSMDKFTCHIKPTNEGDGGLPARLGSFQHVLLRWPGLHDLSLRFYNCKAKHFEYVLAAAARSCRGLRTLRLSAHLSQPHWGILENDVQCLRAIGQWTALQSLSIRGTGYRNCSGGLSALSSLLVLEELVLVDTRAKALEALPALTALMLEQNTMCDWPVQGEDSVDLSKLPLSTKLVSLTLRGVYVDSLPLPPSLTKLNVSRVSTEDQFQHPATLPNLTSLTLNSLACETAPWLSTCSSIQHLTLRNMRHTGPLPNLSHMSKLQTLTLFEHEDIRRPPISDLTSLTELNIDAKYIVAEGVPSLPPLDRLRLLRTLRLGSLSSIQVIPCLSSLPSLQELDIRECVDLEIPLDLPWQLTRLTALRLVGIKNFSGPPPPHGSVVGLRVLELWAMSEVQRLELSPFQALTSMEVFSLPNLVSLEGLEKLTALRKLHISECPHVKTVGLSSLLSLQKLDIYKCPDLEIPMDVSWQLTQLTTLSLVDIQGLSGPPPPPGLVVGLRELRVGDMSEVQRLELSPFQALTSLRVRRMPNLVCLEGLEKLTALLDLDISECPRVKTANLGQRLPNLETLRVEGYVVKLG